MATIIQLSIYLIATLDVRFNIIKKKEKREKKSQQNKENDVDSRQKSPPGEGRFSSPQCLQFVLPHRQACFWISPFRQQPIHGAPLRAVITTWWRLVLFHSVGEWHCLMERGLGLALPTLTVAQAWH